MAAIGLAGIVVALFGGIVGSSLVRTVGGGLDDSMAVTRDAIDALDSSIVVARDTIAVLQDTLDEVERTARGLEVTLAHGGNLLAETAELAATDIADSLSAVEASMPALVRVAATIDRTLTAVGRLPLTDAYEPDQPFDQSVRDLQAALAGMPDDLRRQAELLADAGRNLETLSDGVVGIANAVGSTREQLEQALAALTEHAATTTRARTAISARHEELRRQAALTQVAVWALALTFALGQIVPLYFGRELIAGRRLVSTSRREAVDAVAH